ncbi:hypothetical protein GJ631_17230 [Natronomonas sp. CBA1123]|nr:hypothetical protein [Natronomonas sp. CBA1123]MUV88248.1 hypothetical protein [Natronomonas sp. CBA1123]
MTARLSPAWTRLDSIVDVCVPTPSVEMNDPAAPGTTPTNSVNTTIVASKTTTPSAFLSDSPRRSQSPKANARVTPTTPTSVVGVVASPVNTTTPRAPPATALAAT